MHFNRSPRHAGPWVVAAAAVAVAACGPAGDSGVDGAPRTARGTAGDTVVARTTGSVPEAAIRSLEPVWEAGQGDAAATSFARITSVAVGPDGRVLVWDQRTPAMRLYAADGSLVREVGRIGGGPGEFQRTNLNGIAAMPDGRWIIWDGSGARINVYAADGTYETMWRLPVQGYGTQNALSTDAQGRLWLRLSLWSDDRSSTRVAWLRMRADGTPIDTVEPPPVRGDPDLVARNGPASAVYSRPFGREAFATVSEQGEIIWGLTSPYALHTVHDGRPLRIEKAWTPVPIPDDERARQRDAVERGLRMTQPDFTWDGPDVARERPPVTRVHTGAEGRIWVAVASEFERYTPDPRPAGPSGVNAPSFAYRDREQLLDVFEADGRYVGRVRAPQSIRPLVVRGDFVWGSKTDADGVPTLVKLRVTPGF